MSRLDALRKKLIEKTKHQVMERYSQPDAHLLRAVNALDDLDQIYNLVFEHVREWYGIHYPELERIEKNPDQYLALVQKGGLTSNYNPATLEFVPEDKRGIILQNITNSMGSPLQENQLNAIQSLASLAATIKNQRTQLQAFIETETKARFPRLSELAMPLLAARLISKAGGARNLAFAPSSTLQTLGAEKAMFAHLKNKSRPPKHGLIYNHALIKTAPFQQRGKIARALAGKLAIAMRQDFFAMMDATPISSSHENSTLGTQLDERINRIRTDGPGKKGPKK